MGKETNKKYKDAVDLAKSVKGVQTRLAKAKLKEVGDQYKADVEKAKASKTAESNYVSNRDKGLIDRKIWRCGDQLSFYDLSYMTPNKYKYAVYYEQDKENCPREEQFEHMVDMEFKTFEAAKAVYDGLCDAFILTMSPVTENHIVGKPYKVVAI